MNNLNVASHDPNNKRAADYTEIMARQGKQIFILQLLTLLVAVGSLIVSFAALKIASSQGELDQMQTDNM